MKFKKHHQTVQHQLNIKEDQEQHILNLKYVACLT